MEQRSTHIRDLGKYKIGVVAGGCSSERDISMKSGKAVFKALTDIGLAPLFVELKEENDSFLDGCKLDVVFIALHGRFGEDGKFQKALKARGVIYTGSGPEASNTALDKVLSKEKFRASGISTPEFIVKKRGKPVSDPDIGIPCVVKPQFEGSSIGISFVFSKDTLGPAIEKAAMYDGDVLIEKYIPGRELTVGILKDKALPVVEIVTPGGQYDFDAKYQSAHTRYIVPAQLESSIYEKAQELGVRAHLALGCKGFSRVDMRVNDKGELFVLEVNTIPGFTERSLLPMAAKAAGIDFPDLCLEILADAVIGKRSM